MANLAFCTMGAVLFLFLQFLMDFGLPIMSFTKAEWQPIRKLLDDDDVYCHSKHCPSSRKDMKDTCDRKRCDCVDNNKVVDSKVKVECKKKKIPDEVDYVTESEIDTVGNYEIESETNYSGSDSNSENEIDSVVDSEPETVDKIVNEIGYDAGYDADHYVTESEIETENESHIDSVIKNKSAAIDSEIEDETDIGETDIAESDIDIISETGYEANDGH